MSRVLWKCRHVVFDGVLAFCQLCCYCVGVFSDKSSVMSGHIVPCRVVLACGVGGVPFTQPLPPPLFFVRGSMSRPARTTRSWADLGSDSSDDDDFVVEDMRDSDEELDEKDDVELAPLEAETTLENEIRELQEECKEAQQINVTDAAFSRVRPSKALTGMESSGSDDDDYVEDRDDGNESDGDQDIVTRSLAPLEEDATLENEIKALQEEERQAQQINFADAKQTWAFLTRNCPLEGSTGTPMLAPEPDYSQQELTVLFKQLSSSSPTKSAPSSPQLIQPSVSNKRRGTFITLARSLCLPRPLHVSVRLVARLFHVVLVPCGVHVCALCCPTGV